LFFAVEIRRAVYGDIARLRTFVDEGDGFGEEGAEGVVYRGAVLIGVCVGIPDVDGKESGVGVEPGFGGEGGDGDPRRSAADADAEHLFVIVVFVVVVDHGVDEGHGRVGADGEEFVRGTVNEHPVPVKGEAGFQQARQASFEAAARFDGVDAQGDDVGGWWDGRIAGLVDWFRAGTKSSVVILSLACFTLRLWHETGVC